MIQSSSEGSPSQNSEEEDGPGRMVGEWSLASPPSKAGNVPFKSAEKDEVESGGRTTRTTTTTGCRWSLCVSRSNGGASTNPPYPFRSRGAPFPPRLPTPPPEAEARRNPASRQRGRGWGREIGRGESKASHPEQLDAFCCLLGSASLLREAAQGPLPLCPRPAQRGGKALPLSLSHPHPNFICPRLLQPAAGMSRCHCEEALRWL